MTDGPTEDERAALTEHQAEREMHDRGEILVNRECAVNWWDGSKSHLCRTMGPHDKHQCRYCPAWLSRT